MLGWFAETTMVALALAAVAALVSRVRPIGPTARHILWLAVLVKLLTPPLVCWPWAVAWREIDWPVLSRGAEPVRESPVVETAGADSLSAISCSQPVAMEDLADFSVPRDPTPVRKAPGSWLGVERNLITAWLIVTGLLAAGQSWRILRFRRRLRLAVPAPDDLVAEAEEIARQLGSPVPELLVAPELGTPMLWCLGPPKLVLPAPMVKTIPHERWRGILAHELAHLRRGDHWVSRLELIAGLFWWWNPLYWLTRARLDAEAELACDAWVVWALPKDRLAYAETLFDIGSALSRAVTPAPALGAAGSVRFLERRLTMILHDRVPCRVSPFVLLAAIVLVLLALPSWSAATAPAAESSAATAPALATAADAGSLVSLAVDDDDDDDDDADDDDDDDDDARAKQKAKRDEARAKRDEARAKRDEARAKAAKAKAKAKSAGKNDESDIEAKADKFGSDFEKKMEAFGKEMEDKFGPEFQEKMEKLGKEMETKFGPEFQKKMEKLGKEMEAKFGPGSEFEKQMKDLGKEMEARFGPGSEFEKQMKAFGKDMEAKFGPGSEFEKQMKGLGEKIKEKAEARETKLKQAKDALAKSDGKKEADKDKPTAKATAKARKREARIEALEAQIRKLTEELKALEEEDEDDER
jgi:beta-lactamase regulating signal transducer with metallopeptidase domain